MEREFNDEDVIVLERLERGINGKIGEVGEILRLYSTDADSINWYLTYLSGSVGLYPEHLFRKANKEEYLQYVTNIKELTI